MNPERKICQNCKNQFIIEPEDFDFYEKIKVPPPTWCPECRMVRRMIWRNERTLYRRKCDAPGHEEILVSMYSEGSIDKIYDREYWWSDKWDPLEYGKPYDFNKSFFLQLGELIKDVPAPNLIGVNSPGTQYFNFISNSKNCYLLFGSGGGGQGNEECYYSGNRVDNSKQAMDVMFVNQVERCYQVVDSEKCADIVFGRMVNGCFDSAFLYDCKNCSHCFGCVGLRNKQYHIFNKAYSKTEYAREIEKLDLGSYISITHVLETWRKMILTFPHKYANIIQSQNITGDTIFRSKNARSCFNGWNLEDTSNLLNSTHSKSAQDTINALNSELVYGGIAILDSYNIRFSIISLSGQNSFYSYYTQNCKDIFGCVSLRNKSYCILNKQYTKQDYEILVPKIIEQMNSMPYTDKKGRVYQYGEFFPPELSPFAYNETIAQEYFPLTQEQAIEKGYSWKDPEERNIKITKKTADLPDHIKDVPDSITQEIIECQHQGSCQEQCTTAFKIINQELAFYRQMNLPLPRLCPNCRHYQRLKQRNPLKLWHRSCQCSGEKSSNGVYPNTVQHAHGNNACPNDFETSYAPERPEIVYCETCYQQEVV